MDRFSNTADTWKTWVDDLEILSLVTKFLLFFITPWNVAVAWKITFCVKVLRVACSLNSTYSRMASALVSTGSLIYPTISRSVHRSA